MKLKSFNDLTEEEQNDLASKLMFLTVHLHLSMEIITELEDEPLIWKYQLKQKGSIFLKCIEEYIGNMLMMYEKQDKLLLDDNKQILFEQESIQKQFWKIVNDVQNKNQEILFKIKEEL